MNSSQNINPEANGYHSPHYGHRNHIAYSPTLDYIKQPRVNLTKIQNSKRLEFRY